MNFAKELRSEMNAVRKARKMNRRKYADLSKVDEQKVKEIVKWAKDKCLQEAKDGESYFLWPNSGYCKYTYKLGTDADNNKLRAEEVLRMQHGLNVYRSLDDDGTLSCTYIRWHSADFVEFCIKWYKKIENILYRMVKK